MASLAVGSIMQNAHEFWEAHEDLSQTHIVLKKHI